MTQHPAGWHKTADGAQERYFDGTAWTEHIRQVGVSAPAQPPVEPAAPNPYAQPAADAYGSFSGAQQNPYGAQQPFTQPAYGQQFGAVPSGGFSSGTGDYASWGRRVAAYLIDSLLTLPFLIIGAVIGIGGLMASLNGATVDPATGEIVGGSAGMGAATLGGLFLVLLAALGVTVWNRVLRQGTTGYSVGKSVMGIRLVKAHNHGIPAGVGPALGREALRYVIPMIPYIGWLYIVTYLWPLWDADKQTLDDKAVKTVVINQPKQK
jgi:uncharacterized RDD family membrane protein YckC